MFIVVVKQSAFGRNLSTLACPSVIDGGDALGLSKIEYVDGFLLCQHAGVVAEHVLVYLGYVDCFRDEFWFLDFDSYTGFGALQASFEIIYQ